MPAGAGHYKVTIIYRGKQYTCTTNNMPAVDDYNSDENERDGRYLRRKRGAADLIAECKRKNNIKR